MTTYTELATVPSADTPQTCIHINHEKCHYIFGRVAEGTQRAYGARKLTFTGAGQMFLSGPVGWDQVGGIIGMMLSMATAASATRASEISNNTEREKRGLRLRNMSSYFGVGVHAGDNISHTLACSRSFIFRQPMTVHVHEYRDDAGSIDGSLATREPDWKDEQLKVWKIPVQRARSSSPPKRRRLNSEEPDGEPGKDKTTSKDEFKEPQASSDHRLAQLIVEQGLFNGELGTDYQLDETTVGQLKPTDTALIRGADGVMQFYEPSSDGAQVPDPGMKAWILAPRRTKEDGNEQYLGLKRLHLPKATYTTTSMSYIAKTWDRRGKFDRAAADALGVNKPDFKLLAAGQEVKSKDGKTVTPDMVVGAPVPGKGFIVADIESHEFLESFMQRPEWKDPELMANIAVMYWLLGPNMSSNAEIRKFMSDHAEIKHVICAPDTCPNMITIDSAGELQVKLRRIDAERFPILDFNNKVQAPAPPPDSNVEFGHPNKRVQLMPRVLFDDARMAPFPDLVEASKAGWDEELESLTKAAKAKATDPKFLAEIDESEKDIPNRDAEITCLGTGSSCPSKYRNVSGTLIQVPGIGNYLFDAGEGTLGQIRRFYGEERTAEILRGLRCVVISHLHADHHLGAPSVIKAWYAQALKDGNKANLAIACNPLYRNFLTEIAQVEDIGFHRLHFPCQPDGNNSNFAVDRAVATKEHIRSTDGDDFGLASIKRIPVPHCLRSMATQLELTSGLRVAYSGDCRPSSNFAAACRGAHLLIHECTFGDDMASHARAKNHTTISEALQVSKEMEARRTLLTHFSQRYIKADALRLGQEQARGVLMGFDFMTVKLGDFMKAACYLPALERFMEKLMDKEGYHSA